jgi:hypothetical protein
MPSSSTWRFPPAVAVLVVDAVHLLAVAAHFGGQRAGDDGDVGQAAELGLQHGVGAQLAVEFEQRDMATMPARSIAASTPSCRRRSPPRACP